MWLWCVYGTDRPVGVAVSVCTCTCNTSDDTTNQDMITDDPDEPLANVRQHATFIICLLRLVVT